MPKPSDLLQGTLDLLILKTLVREPLHGWGIAKRIQLLSGEVLSVQQGSLYPALHRLENQGWITAEWKSSELGRDTKVYELTKEGRRQLTRELESWNRLSSAVGLLLQRA
jgi:PadR family transcriptional regulator